MRKLHVSKFNQFRIIVCVIVGLILGLFLVLFSNIFTHFSSNIKTNSVTISCDKEKVKLKIPEETKLSQTQNPILIYSIEKNEDGSEMEIYTQQKHLMKFNYQILQNLEWFLKMKQLQHLKFIILKKKIH